MPITVTLAITSPGSTRAGQMLSGTLTLSNTGSNSVSVRSLQLTEASAMGAVIRQPSFLTSNVAPESSFPTITAGSSASYPFSIVVPSPNTPGAPAQAPNNLHGSVFPPVNTNCRLQLDARTYDSVAAAFVVGSAEIGVPIVSAVAAAISQGGAEQFNAAMNAVNWFF